MSKTLIHAIAETLEAHRNCVRAGNREWQAKHAARLSQLADRLPSGAGLDCGTTIDVDASKPNQIVLCTSFHHMNDVGTYDGWTDHRIVVRPSFIGGIDIQISGRNRNAIKDYLHYIFMQTLLEPVDLEA